MKRFLLSSPNVKGNIEVLYDQKQLLFRLDFKSVILTREQLKFVKNRVPVMEENIYEAFKETSLHVNEVPFEVTFEDFKREYPYKRNTHLAAVYWPRLSSSQQYQALVGAIEYRGYCERNKKWYNPQIPETWLKKQEFLNDWKSM